MTSDVEVLASDHQQFDETHICTATTMNCHLRNYCNASPVPLVDLWESKQYSVKCDKACGLCTSYEWRRLVDGNMNTVLAMLQGK